jgi:hypothetical protein
MGMEFAGDENTNEKTRFRFHCENVDCDGNNYFYANWERPPKLVPEGMPCPFKCGEYAEFCVDIDSIPTVRVRGNFDDGTHNPHYTTARADHEHKWMESQIGEAKNALEGNDQLTGKSATPYAKMTPDMDALVAAGIAKPLDAETAAEKKRIQDERSKIIMDTASDKLTDIERKHAGRRHEG